MSLFNKLFTICQKIFKRRLFEIGEDSDSTGATNLSITPKVHFNSVSILSKTPKNDSVGEKDFITVVYHGSPLWTLFRCPCGCSSVISLSLQKIHRPCWSVSKSQADRPTLCPSVWQNVGCFSHFWIKDGHVHWCANSGIAPWVAEPMYYSKPGS